MPSVILLTPGTRVGLRSRALRVQLPEVETAPASERIIPLAEVERLILGDETQASTAVLAELLQADIPITFTSWSGRVLGLLHPPATRSAGARLEQYRRTLDAAFRLGLATDLIEAKILNSRRILQRLAANRGLEVEPAVGWMNAVLQGAPRPATLDALRGLEGSVSARYFEELARFFPAHQPFERRSRRPPHNPVNAVLSFAYTILGGEIESTLWTCGLDPALGVYHETEDRRASLALDLLEPFRAPVADALAVDLFSHDMLGKEHFETRMTRPEDESGPELRGCFLTLEGRRKFFVQYERRLERQFTSEQTGERTTLRQTLERQCLDLKRAILQGDPFVPFLMN
ncbi:MAG: CRISPR-associated endonuclease Cas1 [Verrucomicrobiae bacterium]|nr:CRISPR-associated endonuclease Cas1 [Verrucomicrobiae bacterium]